MERFLNAFSRLAPTFGKSQDQPSPTSHVPQSSLTSPNSASQTIHTSNQKDPSQQHSLNILNAGSNADEKASHHHVHQNDFDKPRKAGLRTYFWGLGQSTGDNVKVVIITWFILSLPYGLTMGFDTPYIWDNVSAVFPVVITMMYLAMVTACTRTAFTDPGVLPRYSLPPSEADQDPLYDQPEPRYVMLHGGQRVRLKYCTTCHIYRPPRASHCAQCDNCVMVYDHHCPWVNNCIGSRNYRYFVFFITYTTILFILIFVQSIVHILHYAGSDRGVEGLPIDNSFGALLENMPVSFVILVYVFLFTIGIGGLMVYHWYLVSKGMSTHEQIRNQRLTRSEYHYQPPKNPGWYNLVIFCFRPRPPSFPECQQHASNVRVHSETTSLPRQHSLTPQSESPAIPRKERPQSMAKSLECAAEVIANFGNRTRKHAVRRQSTSPSEILNNVSESGGSPAIVHDEIQSGEEVRQHTSFGLARLETTLMVDERPGLSTSADTLFDKDGTSTWIDTKAPSPTELRHPFTEAPLPPPRLVGRKSTTSRTRTISNRRI